MEGKNGKNACSSNTPNEQRSPQRAEGSTQRVPSPIRHQPPPPLPRVVPEPPRPSRTQGGGPSMGGRQWGRMPSMNFLHAIPVVGSRSGPPPMGSIGGFTSDAATRKRVREFSQEVVPSGGTIGEGPFPYTCTVCGKGFHTDKSLFGHMRTHRSRPWRGALPPPVFSREEFADTGLLNPVGGEEEEEVEQEVDQVVVQEETPDPAGVGGGGIQEARGDPEGRVRYRVPDLNQSPPEEGSEDGSNSNME